MSTSGRRGRSLGEEQEPGKKPKKVNSEIRKQQNRIASRNYSTLHFLSFCIPILMTRS
jgi:hypothetical protein